MFRKRSLSDEQIIERVLAGRRDEFAVLVHRYSPLVHAVAYGHVGNHADAEDVAQEAFVKAFQALDTLRKRARFGPWVTSIARNLAAMLHRARARQATATEVAVPEVQTEVSDVENRELRDLLRERVMGLDEKAREVLLLHYFTGRSIAEVAAALDISTEAAKKRLQRAREALSRRLTGELGELLGPKRSGKDPARAVMGAIGTLPVAWEAGAASAGMPATLGRAIATHKLATATAVLMLGLGAWVGNWLKPAEPGAETVVAEGAIPAVSGAAETPRPDAGTAPAPNGPSPTPVSQSSLPKGHGLVWGTVVGMDDVPAAGVTVTLSTDAEGGSLYSGVAVAPPSVETMTDASGRFGFGGLGFARYSVIAAIPGEAVAVNMANIDDDFPQTQVWLELEPAATVAGHVLAASGEGVSGAVLHPFMRDGADIKGWHSQAMKTGFATDATGAFRLDHLWPGRWEFVVKAHGLARTLSTPIQTGTEDAEVVLADGGSARGRVVDYRTGLGIADVGVSVHHMAPWSCRVKVITDDNGAFHAEHLPPGKCHASVEEPYLSTERVPLFIVSEAQEADGIVLRAARGGGIAGRAHDGTGTGLPGIRIALQREGRHHRSTKTDGDGAYRFEGLPLGTYVVKHADLNTGKQKQVSVTLGETLEGVDIVLPRGEARVAGGAVNAQGAPLAGVDITVFGGSRLCKTVTGSEGEFCLHGFDPSSQLWVRGFHPGWIAQGFCAPLPRHGIDGVVLTFREPASISGRITNLGGRPLGEVTVWAKRNKAHGEILDKTNNPAVYRSYTSRSSVTTKGGRFAFAWLVPGTYTLTGETKCSPARALAQVEVAPGEDLGGLALVFEEKPGLTISGRVTDATGRPVARAGLTVEGPGAEITSVMTDRDGRYAVNGLDVALYDFHVFHNDYTNIRRGGIEAGRADVDFRLEALGEMEGRVLHAATKAPVPEFEVALLRGTRDTLRKYDRQGAVRISDNDGRFLLKRSDAGEGTIAVWAEGFVPGLAVVEVVGDERLTGIEVLLAPESEADRDEEAEETAAVEGVVVDASGQPVADASLFADDIPDPCEIGERAVAKSGPDGRFRLDAVPVSVTRLFAAHPEHAIGGAEVGLRAGLVAQATLRLPRPGIVTGTVTRAGEPLHDAWISVDYYVEDERGYQNASTDVKGRYNVEGLVPGEVCVRASTEIGAHERRTVERPAVVEPGQETRVDIDLLGGDAGIEGAVTLDGRPMQAFVKMKTVTTDGHQELSKFHTGRDGKFLIGKLPAAAITLDVTVYRRGGARYHQNALLRTQSGLITRQDFALSSSATP